MERLQRPAERCTYNDDLVIGYKPRQLGGFWIVTRTLFRPHVFASHAVEHLPTFMPRPAPTLPPETLVKIFDDYNSLNQDAFSSCPHKPLTQVCVQWRNLLMDIPRLWTTVDTRSPLLLTSVHYSKHLPLDLRVTNRCEQALRNAVRFVSPHNARIKSLDYQPESINSESHIEQLVLLVRGAETLKVVTYHAPGPADTPAQMFRSSDRSFPGAAPVETLTCHGLRWVAALCGIFSQTLTHLYLFGHDRQSPSAALEEGESSELVLALAAATALIHVELVQLGFSSYDLKYTATLPGLQRLRIVDTPSSLINLLVILSYPTSTSLSLVCKEQSLLSMGAILGQVVAAKLNGQEQIGFARTVTQLGLSFHPKACIFASSRGDTLDWPLFKLDWDYNELRQHTISTFGDVLYPILAARALQTSVTQLHLGPYGPPALDAVYVWSFKPTIMEMLVPFRRLESIHLQRGTYTDIEALLSSRMPFYQLKRLTLSECGLVCTSCRCGAYPTHTLSYNKSPILDRDTIADPSELEELTLRACQGLCKCSIARLGLLARNLRVLD